MVQQKSLILILARAIADELASAMFIVDREGRLVYYNDSAAEILGKSFGEAGEMPLEEWSRAFRPVDSDGTPLDPEELPLVIALRRQRPSHRTFRIESDDGEVRDIAVTALPVFARKEHFTGAVAVFWELEPEAGEGSG